jgi:hypothetical protein
VLLVTRVAGVESLHRSLRLISPVQETCAGKADEVACTRWALLLLGSYQSGQLGLTVNQLSFDFGGSNPSLPT